MNVLTLLLFSSIFAGDLSAAPVLHKIEVIETNNYFTSSSSDLYPALAAELDKLSDLRSYVLKRVDLRPGDDPEVIIRALEWVSSQWRHDGFNEPRKGESALDILKDVHERGARYRCVEYGLVLADLLKSLGYVTRRVSIKSVDAAYGGPGQGHVATEVWSNRLSRWIWLDPQFSVYPTYEGRFLDFHEMYDLKRQGKFSRIRFNVTDGYQKHESKFNAVEYDKDYRKFIQRYFGYLGTAIMREGGKYELLLPLEGKSQLLTFQGTPYGGLFFTKDSRDLYFEMNRTWISFAYRDARNASSQTMMETLGIRTEEDFIAKMPVFAAKPDFTLTLLNNSAWHAHYERRTSREGAWTRLIGSSMNWSLTHGENYLEIRSVNQMGVPGPSTFASIRYK